MAASMLLSHARCRFRMIGVLAGLVRQQITVVAGILLADPPDSAFNGRGLVQQYVIGHTPSLR